MKVDSPIIQCSAKGSAEVTENTAEFLSLGLLYSRWI